MAMAPSPVAEATGLTGRCPHVPGRGHSGHVCLGHPRRTLARPAGRRLAGLVKVAAGKARGTWQGLATTVIHISTTPLIHSRAGDEQRLCSNPPRAYAQVVILAAQKAANRYKQAR